jgi:hypothetical protein
MTQASSGKGNREEVPVVTGRAVRAAGFTAGEVNGVFPGEPIAELLAGLFYLRYVLIVLPSRGKSRGGERTGTIWQQTIKLYWVTTDDYDEDWFICCGTAEFMEHRKDVQGGALRWCAACGSG